MSSATIDEAQGRQAMSSEGEQTDFEDTNDQQETTRRRRRTRAPQTAENIPKVRDETGDRVRESFENFLENYVQQVDDDDQDHRNESQELGDDEELDSETGRRKKNKDLEPKIPYVEQIINMKDFQITTLYVDYSHLFNTEQILATAIVAQYYRFLPHLRRALLNLVNKYIPSYLHTNAHEASTAASGLNTREFSIAFFNLPLVSGIRDMRTDKIGQLISLTGTVTRTSEVRPELIYGTFICPECRTTVRDVEQQFKYTEPAVCPNMNCSNRTNWTLSIEQSKFLDWQKIRIQENANEIPTGSMPRSLDVILRSEIVEKAKAGDKCVFTGTFIVVPDVAALGLPGVNAEMMREASQGNRRAGGTGNQGVTGIKALGVRDLTYKTAFLSCMVQPADSRTNTETLQNEESEEDDYGRQQFLNTLTTQEIDELQKMVELDDIYSRLVKSIAPTVYGHDIVKKGILLQLMGGVHKLTPEGIHLRGDINVCIVGDPSTSKSQFLKYVCGFLPRAVYTSGKASSAAGLTAAVVKDEETSEFTIEAGALMLADNGICAIDEFDKMDIADQVAIHEAMEQQTISIAKAGIQATLNARTSILAAANPVGGRYNRKLGLRANVAMSAPIMSRFDLFFVVLDQGDEETDKAIARHIVNVHRYRDTVIKPEFSTDALQRYIRYARTFNPKMTPDASRILVEKYRDLRQDDSQGWGKNSYRITVRQLESLIRLSEAIARANCSQLIIPAYVKEAYSLLRQSIIHVEKDNVEVDDDDDDNEDGDNADQLSEADGMEEEPPSSSQPGRSSPLHRMREGTADDVDAANGKKEKIVMSYEEYQSIVQLLVMHLQSLEHGHEGDNEEANITGLSREALSEWYLEQIEDDIGTLGELEEKRRLVNKVISKLLKENVLIEIETQAGDGENMETEDGTTTQRILLVHPDYSAPDL